MHVLGRNGAKPDCLLYFWLDLRPDIVVFDPAVGLHIERNAVDQLRAGADAGDLCAVVPVAGRSFFDHLEREGDVLGGSVGIKKRGD
jgi:hypothetical protein